MKNFVIDLVWVSGIVTPFVLPIAVISRDSFRPYVPFCLPMWMAICVCIVFSLVAGHVLMVLFWHSLQERKRKQIDPPRLATALSDNDVMGIRKFLSQTFGGELRLETDYRFPNSFRGDIVAVRGRGRYPIMCFEVIAGNVEEQEINEFIREMKRATEPFENLTQCFVLEKFENGEFKLWKIRGLGKILVGSFEADLRDEIEDRAERAIMTAKKQRLVYPILFLLYVVTPIMESVVTLVYIGFPIARAISAFLAIWIGAFLGVFGAGIKGYEPKVADLMVEE